MNDKLRRRYEQLEAERHRLLETAQSLSAGRLNCAPAGKWSISQILAHLIAAEKMSIDYMSKKIQGIDAIDNTGLYEETKMVLLWLSQRLPFKFRAPASVVERTPVYSEFSRLSADWDTQRLELRRLLEKFDDRQLKKKIYKHIRVGQLNVQHALIFFREHVLHHWPQVKRLL